MKVAIYRIPAGARNARLDQRTPSDVPYVRFGDEVLLYGASAGLGRVAERIGRDGSNFREYPGTVKKENLHLVVQIGSRFQQDHPNVPVVLNKGRYLVVNLDPEQSRKLISHPAGCYRVQPLKESQVVFDVRSPRATRSAPVPWVKDLVGRVSRSNIESNLAHLVSFPTRHSTGPHYAEAAAWAEQKLKAMGYSTRQEAVSVEGATSVNVIAERTGEGSGARSVVMAVAHLDSVNTNGGPSAVAPGADDNGSGSAGLLEIARALQNHQGANDLRFILFGGEEQGLYGSNQYVARLDSSERARIQAVVNMDMIATLNTTSPTVLIEGASVSQAVIDGLADSAATYTRLAVQTTLSPFNSDHVPFIDAGIPAVLTIEGTDSANHNVHTPGDTLTNINYDLILEILRMNVAFVARTVGQEGGIHMAGTNWTPETDIHLTIKAGENLIDTLRSLPFQYSGCYKHNGGASSREGRGFVDRGSGQSMAALRNPIYRLDEPVYVESSEDYSASERAADQLRFTLSIDIDGSDPLNVVSGTVALGSSVPGTAYPHFIGRVSSNVASADGRSLTVENFRFRWPDSVNNIDRLDIDLSGSPLVRPAARVIFRDTTQGRDIGPFTVAQESMYFREVEIDVDREKNALDLEPVSTHVHPDRPTDLPEESLTLESAFANAGIRITRSTGSGTIINNTEAGDNKRWNYSELHDSMRLHWDAFANKPQWKMWVFLAELADDDGLGGVMFDGEINEPGGVDRQGTAIFTRCPHFHTVDGAYINANPPKEEAIKRELFFNLIHETGHAFNLAHSFDKELGGGWNPPPWMPLTTNSQALSWMNYPDAATPGGGAGANATWFYKRFRFRFEKGELLFLRHAPETYVEMGAAGWFRNHARVARINLEHRLKLVVRSLKQVYEMGEPVLVELRLSNESDQPIMAHRNLDPSDGLMELAVTNPKGERRPFLPVDHTRTILMPHVFEPHGEAIYESVDMTMGTFGFPFKEPGAYRIEASYTNIDGGAAAAVMQIYVRPPANYDVVPVVNELFNARVGLALYVDGTRVMDDVNDKLDWVRKGLDEKLGGRNPVSQHLTTVRFKPLATDSKIVEPTMQSSAKVRIYDEEPDVFVNKLAQMLIEQSEATANTMGHIWYSDVVNTYTQAAVTAGEPNMAFQAQEQMVGLFKDRKVVPSVIKAAEGRLNELKGGSAGGAGRRSATKTKEGRGKRSKNSGITAARGTMKKAK